MQRIFFAFIVFFIQSLGLWGDGECVYRHEVKNAFFKPTLHQDRWSDYCEALTSLLNNSPVINPLNKRGKKNASKTISLSSLLHINGLALRGGFGMHKNRKTCLLKIYTLQKDVVPVHIEEKEGKLTLILKGTQVSIDLKNTLAIQEEDQKIKEKELNFYINHYNL